MSGGVPPCAHQGRPPERLDDAFGPRTVAGGLNPVPPRAMEAPSR